MIQISTFAGLYFVALFSSIIATGILELKWSGVSIEEIVKAMSFDHRLNLLTPQPIVGICEFFQDRVQEIFYDCGGRSGGDLRSSVCIHRIRMICRNCIVYWRQRRRRRIVRSGSHERKTMD